MWAPSAFMMFLWCFCNFRDATVDVQKRGGLRGNRGKLKGSWRKAEGSWGRAEHTGQEILPGQEPSCGKMQGLWTPLLSISHNPVRTKSKIRAANLCICCTDCALHAQRTLLEKCRDCWFQMLKPRFVECWFQGLEREYYGGMFAL